jgi:hypothetical protein
MANSCVNETSGAGAFFRKQAQYAQQSVERGKYSSPVDIALTYAAADDRDAALKWLEKAADEHAPWLPELEIGPMYGVLLSGPRFAALLKGVGLEK